jgi:uncharacterized protein (TIGR02145 family)
MDMNYLVQRRLDAQKKYRRKVTITIVLGVILVALILIGLIKVIVDEKKANDWMLHPDDDLWRGEKGLSNPCPCGYRLPTEKEWRALLSLGYEVKTTPEGFYYLSIADGQLLLPAAGLRNAYTGNFQHIGTRGYYWGANAISRGTSACIDFNKDDITTNISIFGFRAFGRSVRCVKDNQ